MEKRWADLFLFLRYVDLLVRQRRQRLRLGRLKQSKRERLAVQQVVRVYGVLEVFKGSIVKVTGAVTVTAVGGAVRLYEAGLTLDPGQQDDDEGKAAA